MLRGAVKFGEDFERNYMKEIFSLEKGMTEAITFFSQYEDADTIIGKDGKNSYQGKTKKTALEKIKEFYNFSMCALAVLAIVLFVTRNFDYPHDAASNSPAVTEKALPRAK